MIPAWLVIGAIAILIGIGLNRLIGGDQRWFFRLHRPSWLTFERAIPFIWISIFIAGGWSAYNIWQTSPGTPHTWRLMLGYALLEILILAYTPVMCRCRSLRVGTIIGATGFFFGLGLSIFVAQVSPVAFLLLLPYLLWSPIGTFVTWQMMQLNPADV
jgi:tryptophan-rich sensory protein